MKISIVNHKIIAISCVTVLLLSGCSTIPSRFWAGEVDSELVQKEHLPKLAGHRYAQVWKYLGEKGTRVVIADAVKPGKTAPELYLFRPNTDDCAAKAVVTGEERYLVIDHTLEESGEYAILVRSKDKKVKDLDYWLAMVKLDAKGTYKIDPDNPKIILSNDILPEVYEQGLFTKASLIIAPLELLPKVVLASIVFIGDGISLTIDMCNVPGELLYKRIVEYNDHKP